MGAASNRRSSGLGSTLALAKLGETNLPSGPVGTLLSKNPFDEDETVAPASGFPSGDSTRPIIVPSFELVIKPALI